MEASKEANKWASKEVFSKVRGFRSTMMVVILGRYGMDREDRYPPSP